MGKPPKKEVCPICRGKLQIPCLANCTHWFCSSCILQNWDQGDRLRTIECPTCRCGITSLVPNTNEQLKNHVTLYARILEDIETYNRVIDGRSLLQRIRDLPFLVMRSLRNIMNPRKLHTLEVARRLALAWILVSTCNYSYVFFFEELHSTVVDLTYDFCRVLFGLFFLSALYHAHLLLHSRRRA